MMIEHDKEVGRCWECGYSLRGLPTPRCPECGRPFDPDDPTTMNMGTEIGPIARWLMKPPSWPVHVLTALAILASLWAAATPMGPGRLADVAGAFLSFHEWTWKDLLDLMSEPGSTAGRFLIGLSIWLLVAAIWIVRRVARAITVKVVSKQSAATFAYWRRWLITPVLLGMTVVACWSRLPAVAGFWLSKAWLEEVAKAAPAQIAPQRGVTSWHKSIGIYPPPPNSRSQATFVIEVRQGETWIWVDDDAAFIRRDDDQPPQAGREYHQWDRSRNGHIHHLYGPWYSVDFARYGEY